MAYIANTAFEVKVSNHEFDSIANITGIYRNAGAAEICSAGFLVKKDERFPNEGYTGVLNTNSWYMEAAGAADTVKEPIYACNTYGVNELTDGATGAVYKVGTNILGLSVPAGVRATYTQIKFNNVNIYRFGIGNVNGEVGENTFFTIANGLLVPAAAAPATAGLPYFELLSQGNFTQGNFAGFGYVDVLACEA